MMSTPVKRQVEAMDDVLQFHQVQQLLATEYLLELQAQSRDEVGNP
jgi:hypothetical protein